MSDRVDGMERVTTEQRRAIHELCWEFEEAWHRGEHPELESWVDRCLSIDRDVVLSELLATELELRSTQPSGISDVRGEDTAVTDATINTQDYVVRFPDQQTIVRNVCDEFLADKKDKIATEVLFVGEDSRYEFKQEIARGGAGAVWRVFDRHLERETAIKVLLDSQDNAEMRRRLELEARLCGRLQHPGIVPVHELDHFDDGRPFISMKLIEGRTLSEMLSAEQPPDQVALLKTFTHACEAVAHAHDQNIIHRDLKPGNIMVGAFEEVQVMDWGLGKELNASSTSHADEGSTAPTPATNQAAHSTQFGAVFGTPAYMSPEQAQGKLDSVDQRTDVFALGGILCRILTGEAPYSGSSPDEVLRLAQEADVTITHAKVQQAAADKRLINLTIECLSADPADRPRDAHEVLRRLRECAAPRTQRMQWPRVAAGAVTVLLLLGLLGPADFSNDEPEEQTNTLQSVEVSTEPVPPAVANTNDAPPRRLSYRRLEPFQNRMQIRATEFTKLKKQGDDEAAQQLLNVREEKPDQRRSFAMYLSRQNQLGASEFVLRELLQDAPNDVQTYVSMAEILTALSRHTDALHELRNARDLDAHHPDVLAALIQALVRAGNMDEVAALYPEALQRNRDNISLRKTLAQAFESIGRTEQAEEVYAELASLDPANSALGDRYLAEREAALKQTAADYPTSMTAHHELVSFLLSTKKFDEAETAAANATELHPKSIVLSLLRCRTLLLNDKQPAAHKIYSNLLASHPNNEALRQAVSEMVKDPRKVHTHSSAVLRSEQSVAK